jgi:hypothetical protein
MLQLWQGLAIAFALFVVASNILYIRDAATDTGMGTLGGSFSPGSADGRRFAIVNHVVPDSPLAKAGIKAGDRLRFDRPYDFVRPIFAGERIGFTVMGSSRHGNAVATPLTADVQRSNSQFIAIDGVSAIIASLIGLVVLVRARRIPSLIALGLAFAAFDYTTGTLQDQAGTFAVWSVVKYAIAFGTPLLFLDFALLFYRENVGPLAGWVWPAFWIAAIVATLETLGSFFADVSGVVLFAGQSAAAFSVTSATFAATILAFFIGWRRGTAMLQSRYAIMLIGLSCFMLSGIFLAMTKYFTDKGLQDQNFAAQAVFEGLATAAPLLFAYAVLRHKVVDLGFAVNRALVYGVVSTVLLVAFGIIEWASEHFLPFQNLETNALVDGGIALMIFLIFHRLRDMAERVIEGLFFRQWHDNEAVLRRFVQEASFIGSRQALGLAAVAELTRFSGGAACALYLKGEGREFDLLAGAAAQAHIDSDDPAIVALRAHGTPIELSDTRSLLPAFLALPMCLRGGLTGFVLMGTKGAGDIYRPDEREVMGWATTQIGFDLHALKIEELENEAAALRDSCATLTAQIALARALGIP